MLSNMTHSFNTFKDLKLGHKYPSPSKRRISFHQRMDAGDSKQQNCELCPGYCCTYEHNSMRITPLEAIDIYLYLTKEEQLSEELLGQLKANRLNYRLDKELALGRGRNLKRYYTCPFFKNGPLGCSLAREVRPYGCLNFNPEKSQVTQVGHCRPSIELWQKRENEFLTIENKINEKLKNELSLYWDKKDIPGALIDIDQRLRESKQSFLTSLKRSDDYDQVSSFNR